MALGLTWSSFVSARLEKLLRHRSRQSDHSCAHFRIATVRRPSEDLTQLVLGSPLEHAFQGGREEGLSIDRVGTDRTEIGFASQFRTALTIQ